MNFIVLIGVFVDISGIFHDRHFTEMCSNTTRGRQTTTGKSIIHR